MYNSGLTPDNTGFKTRDEYKDIPQVVEAFSQNGKFNEDLFENIYKSALTTYNDFSNSKFEDVILANYEYASEE
jgi:hypothetical protein